jgi:hypothetical protein
MEHTCMKDSGFTGFGQFLLNHPRLWPVIRYAVLPAIAVVCAAYHVVTQHIPEFIADYRSSVAELDTELKAHSALK